MISTKKSVISTNHYIHIYIYHMISNIYIFIYYVYMVIQHPVSTLDSWWLILDKQIHQWLTSCGIYPSWWDEHPLSWEHWHSPYFDICVFFCFNSINHTWLAGKSSMILPFIVDFQRKNHPKIVRRKLPVCHV